MLRALSLVTKTYVAAGCAHHGLRPAFVQNFMPSPRVLHNEDWGDALGIPHL